MNAFLSVEILIGLPRDQVLSRDSKNAYDNQRQGVLQALKRE